MTDAPPQPLLTETLRDTFDPLGPILATYRPRIETDEVGTVAQGLLVERSHQRVVDDAQGIVAMG